MHYDCLLVDDEEVLSQSTCEYFNMFDVKTAWVADAEGCMSFLGQHTAEVILLDINLDGSSGFDLCKHLRESTGVPILFISARQSDDDKLLALSIGGDDYIQKPYSLSVLLAKVKVVLGRYRTSSVQSQSAFTQSRAASDQSMSNGTPDSTLTLDMNSRSVTLDGEKIALKLMEFKLLCYLVKNQGRVIGKEELFQRVWEDSVTTDNTLNVHIRRLREKLEANPNNPRFIKTVWGSGYVFERNCYDYVFEESP